MHLAVATVLIPALPRGAPTDTSRLSTAGR